MPSSPRYSLVGAWALMIGLASAPVASVAQDVPSLGARGGQAIVLGTGQGTVVGLDVRVGSRTDLVLETAFRIADEDNASNRGITVRPGLKRYMGAVESAVAPYLLIAAQAEWGHADLGPAAERDRRELGGLIAIGVDWLPAQRVSIAGHVGTELSVIRVEQSGPAQSSTTTGSNLATLSSGIRLRLFL